MAAGRAKNYLDFYERTGNPPVWTQRLRLCGEIKTAKSTQRISGTSVGDQGLRHPAAFLMTVRTNPAIEAGLLVRTTYCGVEGWFSVDSVVNEDYRGQNYLITARQFQGAPGTYKSTRTGTIPQYTVMVWVNWNNPDPLQTIVRHNITNLRMSDIRITMECLGAQLVHPFMLKGDVIEVQGVEYELDGLAAGGYDGYTVTFDVRPRSNKVP